MSRDFFSSERTGESRPNRGPQRSNNQSGRGRYPNSGGGGGGGGGFANRRHFRGRPRQDVGVLPPTPGELEHLRTLALEAMSEETGFSKLSLDSLLLGALRSLKFDVPTPIQEKSIPIVLAGKDILGCAQTGTGKTLAFVVPILHQLMQRKEGKALILVPTRELGLQIEEVLKTLTKKLDLGLPVILIGGVSYFHQFRQLEQKHRVIVATPGRLIDHLSQNKIDLKDVTHLVLDEADRMLDVGFKPQLNEILTYLSKERQTMMFTATLSAGVRQLSNQYLRTPVAVSAGEITKANENITQTMVEVEGSKKNDAVLEILKLNPGTVLMFVKTQIKTERVADWLLDFGVQATPIHGGLRQGQRKRAIDDFREEKVRVLVATDVAARGLDIDHVNLVINYDLPHVVEDYVHRIGRTGRAGRKGQAISLVSGEDRGLWRMIARKYIPGAQLERRDDRPRRSAGGRPDNRSYRGGGREDGREAGREDGPRRSGGFRSRRSY